MDGLLYKKYVQLKFTPLEFETIETQDDKFGAVVLKFTPLEFETA